LSFTIPLSDRARLLSDRFAEPEPTAPAVATPSIRAAVEAALDRGETHYTDRPGILPLREKIAAQLRLRFGLDISAKNDLVVTCGVTEARFVATQQLLRPGETLAAPVQADRLFGAAALRRSLLTAATFADTQAAYLTSSTPEDILRAHLAATSPDAAILYEVDDAESRFHPAQLAAFAHRTVTIGRLGEASWRIGYLASPGPFSPGMRDFKQALTICSTNLSQWAALAAMGPLEHA
jgi:DNA-binding transcriptional MocR family regulator